MLTSPLGMLRERGAAHGTASADDAGMTVIELVVAMVLTTIVAAMSLAFFVNSLGASTTTTNTTTDTSLARNTLDSWTALIRLADSPQVSGTSADRFEQIGPSDLVFYANINNRTALGARTAPVKIWLSYTGSQLIERRYLADNPNADPTISTPTYSTYPNTPVSTTIKVGCASGTTTCATPGAVSAASFTAYYTKTGCLSGNLSAGNLCTVDPAATPSLQDAVAVGISISITAPGGNTTQTFTSLAAINAAVS